MAMMPLFEPVNIAMVYLLAVVVIALRFTRGAAVLTSIVSVAAFDFFFVPPRFTFAVADMQYLVTFAIMLVVAIVISALVAGARQAETEYVRSTLLASISHDLRTPLAVISGASSSLAERGERLSAEERRALAQSIYRHSVDMSELVANVLQMTRLEHGSVEPAADWVALGEIVGSALARLGERLAVHRVDVALPDDLPLVRVDPTLVEQVFANLLENAAKYTPAGTRIIVRAQVRDTELLISVEDEGPGLPPGADEVLFAKLQRGERESVVAGVGLGLSICRAVVRLHGGRIWVERRPEGGTAFRFTLPLEQMPRIPSEAASPAGGDG
jgi:two-component system sensor histidine kinase KdpD